MIDRRVYDIEAKQKDGTWAVWETVEGLENTNKKMSDERWAMARREKPYAEIRKTLVKEDL